MEKDKLLEYKKKLSKLNDRQNKLRNIYLRKLATGELEGPMTGYPSIDKPWLKYYSVENIKKDFEKCSMYQLAYKYNFDANNMDNIAMDIRSEKNDFEFSKKITYKHFFDKVYDYAKSLKVLGVEENEIIPIFFPNIPEARYLMYGINYVGGTSYPISPMLPINQLKKILNENEIKNVFISSEYYHKFKDAFDNSNIKNIIIFETNKEHRIQDNMLSFDQFETLKEKYQDKIEPYYNPNHIAIIIGTSGTTGISKGVCITDDNINSTAIDYLNSDFFHGKFLDALIPSIVYGIGMMHYEIVGGHYVYLVPELLTTRFPEAFQKLKPDSFPGGPVHYITLANSEEFKNDNIIRGGTNLSGGASLPRNVEKELNGVNEDYIENEVNNNIIVRQGFALSENTAIGTYNKKGAYSFGSVGIPAIYENVAIFEPNTDNELPYYKSGEICISGKSIMKEYLNNRAETSNVLKVHSDGKLWVHTGDIGYMDESGHLYHEDRIKNIFMRFGFNIHPGKIADTINNFEGIKNCSVIGFSHPFEQTVPVAFIELDKENNLNEYELIENLKKYCYENLEEIAIPVDFVIVDYLPINAGGKIDNSLLKENSEIDFYSNLKVLKKHINFRKS